ncbi:MAG: hypothetical protein JRG68_08715 [Deltaproteobacteria bacterium]|nr:hypothetical protein [Deltaproteobacteria bacterium]MBW2100816.1 hypothetical protein [Deltaproteobacteria bacterium]
MLYRQTLFKSEPDRVFACKHDAVGKTIHTGKIPLKHITAKGKNIIQTAGMNNHLMARLTVFLEQIEQFACRRTVKVAY